ncbi:DUF6231 family protein [Marinobacter zhejiangensis]|uniref:Uncharacterized protein n=1 Tax=Marinobacter zhejiangensis TaxID=488535 RepID=A0A1I4Q4R6_9GAMM|nr:DUF6231 family protein [Marinobacter zhejiangensis]SFM34613.1 hypothetical protein SAMN04487963_2158 [Marinobacter zhejiangensis]
MTDQICNRHLSFEGTAYELLESHPGVFSPWDYGIEPEDVETSNGSGYELYLKVEDKRLFVDCLVVGYIPPKPARLRADSTDPLDQLLGEKAPLPLLNGVRPEKLNASYWHYSDVNLALDYTGTLVAGTGKDVLELTFKAGQLVATQARAVPEHAPDILNDLPPPELQPPQPVEYGSPITDPCDLPFDSLLDVPLYNPDATDEVLAQIIGACQPKVMLSCGHTAESLCQRWQQSVADVHLTALDSTAPNAAFPLSVVPDLALVSDTLEQLSREEGILLMGQLRNYGSHQIAVLVSDSAGWTLTDFTSLGFRRHAQLQTASGPYTLYTYNLDSYNHKRSWNNPDHWANPEMWGKAWW